jgi:hypothetical protein
MALGRKNQVLIDRDQARPAGPARACAEARPLPRSLDLDIRAKSSAADAA